MCTHDSTSNLDPLLILVSGLELLDRSRQSQLLQIVLASIFWSVFVAVCLLPEKAHKKKVLLAALFILMVYVDTYKQRYNGVHTAVHTDHTHCSIHAQMN